MSARRFTNIAEIRKANSESGKFWFSPATVSFFASKVETRVYDEGTSYDYPQGARLWVESTRTADPDSARREYKIVRFNVETHDIDYVHSDWVTLRFTNLGDAESYLTEKLLRRSSTEPVEDWHGQTTGGNR